MDGQRETEFEISLPSLGAEIGLARTGVYGFAALVRNRLFGCCWDGWADISLGHPLESSYLELSE